MLTIYYTNSRGIGREYNIVPIQVFFGRTEFHSEGDQWFLRAFDVDRQVIRDFAMRDFGKK